MARGRSSTQAGYGADHRRVAALLKEQMRKHGGTVCARGGEWLHVWQLDLDRSDPRSIHADHEELPLALGGVLPNALSCAHHNTQHGARLGNRMRGARRHGQAVVDVAAPRPRIGRVVLEW